MAAEARLLETSRAFDALALDYDRSEESNRLLLLLRAHVWHVLTGLFPPGARLLDLGCGTGIDAAYLASLGYRVLATDLSPAMAARTVEQANRVGVQRLVEARAVAIEDLGSLHAESFDGIYSNRGPFNCAGDLEQAARDCSRLLAPGGLLVATVIGRWCPWEILFYASRLDFKRALQRRQPGFVPVRLKGETVPTKYYTPREIYRAFAPYFDLADYRSLGLFVPPTYLDPLFRRHPRLGRLAWQLDRALGGLPGLRNAGDLFLIVLRKRG